MGTDSDLRRAISTAYYALFHTVAASSANFIIAERQTSVAEEAWRIAYRALDHGMLKNACLNKAITSGTSGISTLADVLPRMQSKRHIADYHPTAVFAASEVNESINECEAAMIAFEASDEADRRAFVAFALFRIR